jgi:hypothetical protein
MVKFSLVTPLGIPVEASEFEISHRQLERAGGLRDVNRAAVRQVLDSLIRDAALQEASGRWNPGRPDPDQFVPGDIAAIRAIASDSIVRGVGAISLQHARTLHLRASLSGSLDLISDREGLVVALDPDRLLEQPIAASLLVDLHQAVPYFMPTTAAAAVLASRPPSHTLQQELRVPFERTLVLFGADLEIEPTSFPWPEQFPRGELDRFGVVGVVGELVERGGHLSGLVLLADNQGHLRDDVIWLLAANPRPDEPWPGCLDRIRGLVRGFRSAATLTPLVTNVAAALAWAVWRDPPPAPDLPADPTPRQLRKALKRNSVRVRERQGALVGVRTLDLTRNATRPNPRERDRPGPGRASPIPHMRSGHFRNVRVGPRTDFRYEPRWIPPTWVKGSLEGVDQRVVVRRIPAPVTWTRQDPNAARRQVSQQHPSPAGARQPKGLPASMWLLRAIRPFPPSRTRTRSRWTSGKEPAMGEWVRTVRARLDDLEDRRRRIQRPQRHRTLPTPAPAAVVTAIIVVEVRAGLRPPHQLERLSHYSLWPAWADLAQPPPDRPVPIIPRPLAVTVREVSPGLVDATVVIDFGGRTHALGLRLDGAPGFWQLVELDYPTQRISTPERAPLDEPLPTSPARESNRAVPDDHELARHWEASPGTSPRPSLPGDPSPQRLGDSLDIELE